MAKSCRFVGYIKPKLIHVGLFIYLKSKRSCLHPSRLQHLGIRCHKNARRHCRRCCTLADDTAFSWTWIRCMWLNVGECNVNAKVVKRALGGDAMYTWQCVHGCVATFLMEVTVGVTSRLTAEKRTRDSLLPSSIACLSVCLWPPRNLWLGDSQDACAIFVGGSVKYCLCVYSV